MSVVSFSQDLDQNSKFVLTVLITVYKSTYIIIEAQKFLFKKQHNLFRLFHIKQIKCKITLTFIIIILLLHLVLKFYNQIPYRTMFAF